MLNQIATWVALMIETIVLTLGYPGIALVMLIENLFPPIPSELVMPFAGFLAAQGKMDFTLVIISGTIGAVLGAIALYYVGMWADETIIRRFVRRWGKWFTISETELNIALTFFMRRGEAVVFFGRLIPLIRSLISIPAGMRRMNFGRFLLFTSIGTLLWNLALTLAGSVLGANWKQILSFLGTYQNVTVAVLGLGVLGFIGWRLWQKRSKLIS
ncbi:MAG: DedA family protein [Chloroflexota bacterium]|jgi:membrane protein DedA with SNARE-associated domain|nr:DedA family protein [Chloroflexota bacterium]